MFKTCISLLLMLALLLPGFAAAQSAVPVYTPGSVAADLFADAFESGSFVCADLDLEFALNKEMLGITGEEAIIADAIIEVINSSVLSAGAAKSDEGLMLTFSALYAKDENETSANAGIRLCLNEEGLYIETSLLPGERVTASWETVFAMLGVDSSILTQIRELREVDLNAMLAELEQAIEQLLPAVNQIAAPYLSTFAAFMESLPVSVSEDVAADGYFPAAKQEIAYTLTQKAVGGLLAALADQLSADATLSALLDVLLTNPEIMGENAMTTAALCENIRTLAAGMTDESTPIYIFIGLDESSQPLYVSIMNTDDAGMTIALNAVKTPETADSYASYIIELFTVDAQENYSGAYVTFMANRDPADKNSFDFAAVFELAAENMSLLSMEYAIGSTPMTTEENLPGYSGYQSTTVTIADPESGAPVSVVSTAEFSQYLTADGGETHVAYSITETALGETAMQSTEESYFGVIPGEDGPLGLYTSTVTQPGVDSAAINVSLYAIPNETPERTAILALETAAQEDLDALVLRLMTNAQEPLDALLAQLPAPILDMIAGALASEAPADTAPAVAM